MRPIPIPPLEAGEGAPDVAGLVEISPAEEAAVAPPAQQVPEVAVPERPPEAPMPVEPVEERAIETRYAPPTEAVGWARSWRFPLAIMLALVAQLGLEARPNSLVLPIALYLLAAAFVGWEVWLGTGTKRPQEVAERKEEAPINAMLLANALIFGLFTFLLCLKNEFSMANLTTWAISLMAGLGALWERQSGFSSWPNRLRAFFRPGGIQVRVTPFHILFAVAAILVVYFRFAQIDSIPYDMSSDHAEKLYDVMDVLRGETKIFFPRNAGREAIQFYLAAATAKYLGLGISFMTLKVGTVVLGLLVLPYLYLFAREIGGREVGLAAFVLAGIAYWPNVISRMGLRYPLYPLFVAPVFYHLVRGFRTRSRNHLLLAGLFAGLGLHGFTSARVVPLALALGGGIYALYQSRADERLRAVYWVLLAGLIALLASVPLLGVATAMPETVFHRMLTRLAEAERSYPGPVWQILLKNIWNGLLMFGWDNGEFWFTSIPHRPALDWVTAGLFHLGLVIVLVQFLRRRDWKFGFLLLSLPLLMLPSILALAFPQENPAPHRAGGAMVPVFTMAAIPLVSLVPWAGRLLGRGRRKLGSVMALLLLLVAASLNHDLLFRQFAEQIRRSMHNTRQIGEVIRGYATSVGDYDSAYVIPYPHWVDNRLVGITAGVPGKDYTFWREDLVTLQGQPGPHLFLFKPEDEETEEMLQALFPGGELRLVAGQAPGRDFKMYFVPAGATTRSPQ
jgi:hypothetical protein